MTVIFRKVNCFNRVGLVPCLLYYISLLIQTQFIQIKKISFTLHKRLSVGLMFIFSLFVFLLHSCFISCLYYIPRFSPFYYMYKQ